MSEKTKQDKVEHRPGCEALGGYGHGVGPCDCGVTPPSAPQAAKQCALCWGKARTGSVCDACHDSMGTAPQAALPPGYAALIQAASEVLMLRTNGDKLTAAASLALDERLCLIAIKMRSAADALAHGTSYGAALSDEQIKEVILQTVYEGDSTVLYRDQWTTDIGIPFARAILAEAGIKEKP